MYRGIYDTHHLSTACVSCLSTIGFLRAYLTWIFKFQMDSTILKRLKSSCWDTCRLANKNSNLSKSVRKFNLGQKLQLKERKEEHDAWIKKERNQKLLLKLLKFCDIPYTYHKEKYELIRNLRMRRIVSVVSMLWMNMKDQSFFILKAKKIIDPTQKKAVFC